MDFNFSIQWHITSKCRNRCTHCYMFNEEHDKMLENELEYSDFLKILDNIKSYEDAHEIRINDFIITGGDPFSHKDFADLLEELKRRGKNIYILGIPETVDSISIDLMKRFGVSGYQLSIDGMPQTHDKVRGVGSFHKTILALNKLEAEQIPSIVMYTVNKSNVSDLLNVVRYLDKQDIKTTFAFDFMVCEGNASGSKEEIFSSDEAKNLFDEYIALSEEFTNKKSTISLVYKSKLLNTYRMYRDNNEPNILPAYFIGCYIGVGSIAILPNGDVYPCRRLPIKVGNMLEDDFENIFLSNETMKKVRRREYYKFCGDCRFFSICRGCPALAYSLDNDVFGKLPFCFFKKTVPVTEIERSYPPIQCSSEDEFKYLMSLNYYKKIDHSIKANIVNLLEKTKYLENGKLKL